MAMLVSINVIVMCGRQLVKWSIGPFGCAGQASQQPAYQHGQMLVSISLVVMCGQHLVKSLTASFGCADKQASRDRDADLHDST